MSTVFTITYWGTTGTITDPILPAELTAKITDCLEELARRGRLAQLRPGPTLRQEIERELGELPLHLRSTYGGNTTSVEVRTPDALLLLDCGSGFRELGRALQQRWKAEGDKAVREAHILISHSHMDHSFATPFFPPYYDPRNHFTIWGNRLVLQSLDAVLSPTSALSHVYFPPTFDMMQALRRTEELNPWQEFHIGETKVRTFPLRHPGGGLAFRFDRAGKAYVFATDHEEPEGRDEALASFARGADVLYTEGQYTQSEYEGKEALPGEGPMPRRGWGHSSIEACVRTAIAAGVKTLHLGHRDPARSDADLARLEEHAQRLAGSACRVLIPHEGLTGAL